MANFSEFLETRFITAVRKLRKAEKEKRGTNLNYWEVVQVLTFLEIPAEEEAAAAAKEETQEKRP